MTVCVCVFVRRVAIIRPFGQFYGALRTGFRSRFFGLEWVPVGGTVFAGLSVANRCQFFLPPSEQRIRVCVRLGIREREGGRERKKKVQSENQCAAGRESHTLVQFDSGPRTLAAKRGDRTNTCTCVTPRAGGNNWPRTELVIR